MNDMDDEQRRDVLGEALMEELRAIREGVGDVSGLRTDVRQLQQDVEDLTAQVLTARLAVTDLSREVHRLRKTQQQPRPAHPDQKAA